MFGVFFFVTQFLQVVLGLRSWDNDPDAPTSEEQRSAGQEAQAEAAKNS